MVVARNPTQYGFTPMATDKPLAYDSVTVTRAVDLRRIAEWTDAPLEAIQALNPELRRWTTPVRAERYDVKVPLGTGDKLRERLASAPASRPRRAALVSRQARRIGRDDRAQAGREPRRSRRSERAVGQGAGPARPGSAGAARAVDGAGRARRDRRARPPATRAPPRRPRRAASGRRIRRAARASSTRCAAATRSRRSPAPSTPRSPRSSRPTSCAAATSPPAIASRSTARRRPPAPRSSGRRLAQFAHAALAAPPLAAGADVPAPAGGHVVHHLRRRPMPTATCALAGRSLTSRVKPSASTTTCSDSKRAMSGA